MMFFNWKSIIPRLIPLPAIFSLLMTCGGNNPSKHIDPEFESGFKYHDFTLNSIDYPDRWYNNLSPLGFEFNFPHDENGIRLFEYNGDYYYHPWQISKMGLWYLSSFQQTSDSLYLDILYRYVNKIVEIGTRVDSAIYLPYRFNYALHNGAFNEVMIAPWYSGMAQGVALSFLIRSYDELRDPYLRAVADSIYYSFVDYDHGNAEWITTIDTLDYYWIEEYPFIPYTHVLNGFIFGIEGLYDYWYVSADENCGMLIKGALTTLVYYFDQWRNSGSISYYCLMHKASIGSYHTIHINMFRFMGVITSDSIFYDFADTLESDYPPQ